MNATAARVVRFAAASLVLVGSGWFLTGRAETPVQQGLPTDWSHHHLVFSRPRNSRIAARVERDPRYWQQFARRNVPRLLSIEPTTQLKAQIMRRHRKTGGGNATKISRDWSENMGSGASVGATNYPAKFSFSTTTATCATDFVVFNTGLSGSPTQASIVAYNNMYSGCGSVPQTYWAYNTGGQILTSVTFSQDGTQVAFTQTSGAVAGTADLVLLKWKASNGTVGAPITPANAPSAYRTCVAPCMIKIPLRTSAGTNINDITSSVFPDYPDDILYVGGELGWLHKITGAFLGTPQEVQTGGFPAQLNPTNPNDLTSPVFDGTSIFVGDLGGFFYRVDPTSAAVVKSAQLDHGAGLRAGPYVDTTANVVYVFASSDGTTGCSGNPCSAVYALNTGFAAGASGTKVTVGSAGTASTPNVLYTGDFDSTYQNSTNATGNLYVCGNTGGVPNLYQIPIAGGVPGTVSPGVALANSTAGCSAITDIYNPSTTPSPTEWIFLSVQNAGKGGNCGGLGCLFSFIVTPWTPSQAYTAGQVVLDSHFHVQVVATPGTSGATTPTWSQTTGNNTSDGSVKWLNQGPYNAATARWAPSTPYALGAEVIDSNGKIELCTNAGTSGTQEPSWSTGVGGNTAETQGGAHWTNLGTVAISNALATGGSSGIILDNTVVGTLGTSQIYFSTLSDQNCTTSGTTGGCAIQASQTALK